MNRSIKLFGSLCALASFGCSNAEPDGASTSATTTVGASGTPTGSSTASPEQTNPEVSTPVADGTKPALPSSPGSASPTTVTPTNPMPTPVTPTDPQSSSQSSPTDPMPTEPGTSVAPGPATAPSTTDAPAPDMPATDGVCPPACGPTTDQFYDNAKVATIKVTIGEEALDGYKPDEWIDRLFEVRNQCTKDYIRSSFSYESPDGIGNVSLEDVGIRARGSMDISVNKMKGFKLNFHKPFYEEANPDADRRRFADINRLNTLSLEPAHSTGIAYDKTHAFQCLTYKLMRDFDVLAPQCNHLRVYVNDAYYGLMQNIEETDHGRFLAHRFGSTDGMIVEVSPSMSDCGFRDGDGNLTYKGDAMSDYAMPKAYVIDRGTDADAEANMIPMFKCADATATPSDDDYKACISDWLDVGEWLRLIAAESILPELETLAYDRNVNLYFKPDATAPHGGRWLVSIWDVDATLNGQACTSGGGGGFGGGGLGGGGGTRMSACDPLTSTSSLFGGSRLAFVTRLTTVFRTEYCQALNDFLDNVYKSSAADDMAKVMEGAMMDDPVDSQQDWQAAITETHNFIDSNGTAMRDLVATACQ